MNPKVFEICEKYNYDFPAIRDKRFNETLQSALEKVAMACPSLMDEYETVLTHNEVCKEKHYLALRGKKNSGAKMNKEENRTLKNLQLYADEHDGKPLFKRDKSGHVIKFKYEMVTSHTARRSGVTNMYLDGVLDTREMMSISLKVIIIVNDSDNKEAIRSFLRYHTTSTKLLNTVAHDLL